MRCASKPSRNICGGCSSTGRGQWVAPPRPMRWPRRGAGSRQRSRAPSRNDGAWGTRRARRVAVRHRGAPRLWHGAGSVARAVRWRGARLLGARRPHAAGCAACCAARRGASAGCERHRADAASIVRIAAVGHRSGARSRQRLHGRPDVVRRSGRDRRIGAQAVPSARRRNRGRRRTFGGDAHGRTSRRAGAADRRAGWSAADLGVEG